MHVEYANNGALGISRAHRELLSKLHRECSSPFYVGDAAKALNVPRLRAARLLAHWASRGWLSRIRRGVYITVPLDAVNPSEWKEDPGVVAHSLYSPCYIGGWTAAEHWGLTEQIFSDTVVFTASNVRTRTPIIKGMKYLITVIPEGKLFGLRSVWRENTRISVSDPARTIADMLDNPRFGGGIKHVAEMIAEFFDGEHRNDDKLIEYVRSLGNRTICKRLGFILEHMSIDAPSILPFCAENISAGYSKLDPTVRTRGRLVRKWNLDINVTIPSRAL